MKKKIKKVSKKELKKVKGGRNLANLGKRNDLLNIEGGNFNIKIEQK